ncbi:hypothetical protein Deide_1p01045 (plasmid) [Deinococcus deserti VCD115]|uniref:Uncharacterized protein n=1 Tax=Deinococcus deserti (strain DSM 17065 / CIP 109153 / LMG 22923 / VCD115) TaxID=546414 RepID=X5GY75_DEIDV|nr:hypothetical protein Deide_1p01045 [Deinococcus deserti VCD115]
MSRGVSRALRLLVLGINLLVLAWITWSGELTPQLALPFLLIFLGIALWRIPSAGKAFVEGRKDSLPRRED